MVNVTKHVLQPKYEVLTANEKQKLLKKYKVEEKQVKFVTMLIGCFFFNEWRVKQVISTINNKNQGFGFKHIHDLSCMYVMSYIDLCVSNITSFTI